MKVLIIGSKGFIGSHLLATLRLQKTEAWGCDVVSDPTDKQYFHYDGADIDFEKLFKDTGFTHCYNCSGSASVPFSFSQPSSDFTLNTVHVFGLLDAIRKHVPACRFIQLSSAAVYGNPQRLPVSEESELDPLSIYGYHKQMAEQVCEEFNRFFDLKILIVRIFSAYGEGLKKQLFWDLFQKAKESSVIELSGTGSETRDFIYISDLVSALLLLGERGNFSMGIYNIANGEEISIKMASETFAKSFNPSSKVSFNGNVRAGDPAKWKADISKLKSLGYSPKVTFSTGISNYVNWLRKIQ